MDHKIFNYLNNIFVNKSCLPGINDYIRIFRNFLQLVFNNWFIQERTILSHSKQVMIIMIHHQQARLEICSYNKEYSYADSDQHPYQQVGNQDGKNGYNKGKKLVHSTFIIFLKKRRLGKFIPRKYKNCC